MASRPTIVLVHGFWGGAAHWSKVIVQLSIWYQVSSEDRMIHPESQERMSARLGARRIITLAAGHASLASKPVEVGALIDEAARATCA